MTAQHQAVVNLIVSQAQQCGRARLATWADYERYKKQIAAIGLSPNEYEDATNKIVRGLGLNVQ